MKQIPLTPELEARIKKVAGPDVDVSGVAVFEAIAINTHPLPGKDGTIHERAVVSPSTIHLMAEYITSGNNLPLISDHELMGTPKGRVFDAEPKVAADGQIELRVLFYLDQTERRLITKLNAGSLAEVSVSFLPESFTCSACGWDYFSSEATIDNLFDRTCANGHTIGEDGVHAVLGGLADFNEISLVARGAANKALIVGPSDSKLTAKVAKQLATGDFSFSRLAKSASTKEPKVADMNFDKLAGDLVSAKTDLGLLEAKYDAAATELQKAIEARDTAEAKLADLEASADDDLAAKLSEAEKSVADKDTEIEDLKAKLAKLLPEGGVSQSNTENKEAPRKVSSAFRVR